jgi:N6-adenosine-specific RNA methylase IME4
MTASLPRRGFHLVLADPPWKFDTWSASGGNRAAARHYPVMEDEEIIGFGHRIGLVNQVEDGVGRPIVGICARDCWLAMWATFSKLKVALAAMEAWGFVQVSGGSWGKMTLDGSRPRIGTGYTYRDSVEPWLLGKRGSPDVLGHGTSNLILAPRREHSRKPTQMMADIERTFPGPYLELFATERRRGWHSWGNQLGKYEVAR